MLLYLIVPLSNSQLRFRSRFEKRERTVDGGPGRTAPRLEFAAVNWAHRRNPVRRRTNSSLATAVRVKLDRVVARKEDNQSARAVEDASNSAHRSNAAGSKGVASAQ